MGLKTQLSFSSGEVDPILHDRVTLEKFKKGLATARNVMIGKTGSVLTRFPRGHFVKSKNNSEVIHLFSPPNSNKVLEWGPLYVRIYGFDTGAAVLDAEVVHTLTAAHLTSAHFIASGVHVYVFVAGIEMTKLLYDDSTPALIASADKFAIPAAPTSLTVTPAGTPTGYAVHYLVTKVLNGEESAIVENTGGAYDKPLAAGQSNLIDVIIDSAPANEPKYNSIRVYRRPAAGGAYGLIGTSTDFYTSGSVLHARFTDLGGNADFNNGVPEIITKTGLDGVALKTLDPKTGAVYQQRLLLANLTDYDNEAILAGRPGYQNNFYRDFPYNDDSALKFKSGTSGKASVLRMVENDGLIVFTNIGVFVSVGALSIDNLSLEKKGAWVIDEAIPPLEVPGGVFFVDKKTNSVRQLIYSQDILTYESIDQSIFSEHLFKQKTISSWAFQEGTAPMIVVTFSDGTFATFTYHFEHQMRAWTRHDSAYPLEQVEGTGVADASFFVTNKDGNRYIEVSLPRYVPAATITANTEYDKLNSNAFMDAIKTTQTLLNDSLGGSDVFLLTPITTDRYDLPMTLDCGTSAIFGAGTYGVVGTIMRFFDPVDRSTVDLEVTARASDNSVTVEPSAEFPLASASGFRLYATFTTVSGLDHLDGENASIMVDGYVSASPYNDVEGYDDVAVSSGSLTLPNSERGAIVIVGRPIVADIKTLNISSVEQKPTLIESMTVNKLYVRIHETRGLYVDNEYPEEESGGTDGTSILGMEDMDVFDVPSGTTLIGNRYKTPASKRIEITLKGSWESNGEVAFRQVDPVHFEILSIIPDVEVLKRSDR